ncbi:site-specific DNA-methyltransferase [Cloacibacillus evryensis]|uniref:Site-specific DNA-methyltransferase n=2 Tax=Cloacibacillus evryensis TaxID=508460 RepID=A0AAW5K4I4_9BACT|nr:site-specific DNA-methyltransferase [Cloacibacillus evryensis]MCQ4812924.1 site-specific DNA-methyltransferase [Cloacibacillus evryensis]
MNNSAFRIPHSKLKMHTPSLADEHFAALAALFPNAVTETIDENGTVVRAIDKDVLMQEISAHVVEGREERYQFTWPDKRKSILLANAPIAAALRPCRAESVDFDTTENLYIEGDNLDVLKLLRETYLGRVKMIYIDPPYNTGHDFVYEDDFSIRNEEFGIRNLDVDEQGNRLVQNLDSNGRFHTDWLNMLYPRLRIARDFLTEDGVIFISIDDNEVDNLKKIANEVFGSQNFIAQLVWQRAFSPKNDARFVSNSHDYVLMYAKALNSFTIGRLPRTEEANARYSNPDNDPRGVWMSSDISVKTYNPNTDYPITAPSGRVIEPPTGRCWSLSKNEFLERLHDNRIWFGPDGNGAPRIKRFLTDLKFDGMAPTSIMLHKDVGHSQEGSQEVTKLLEAGVFDGPKPVRLLRRLLTLANLKQDSIVLDFFSGSATTAHAVMQLNAEDGGHRKFVLVQIPELTDEKSEAAKAGYSTICEIGKERIRRAGAKINSELGIRKAELKSDNSELQGNSEFRTPNSALDIGFRVLKLDSSNMKDVYYTPDELLMAVQRQQSIFGFMDNIKEDRSPEDLLFQVLLDFGIPLSSPIRKAEFGTLNCTVFDVANGYLLACFEQVDTDLITTIAKMKPYHVVFRDSSFISDSAMVNFEQVFNTYSPSTIRRVL